MKRESLQFGWTLEVPENLSVLTNDAGEVALIYDSKNFGDILPLVFQLSETTADIKSIPHHVDNVSISMDKVITVTLSKFVDEFEQNQG